MKKKSAMVTLDLMMTLTTCEGGNAGTTAAPSSGSETQIEARAEEKTEGDTTTQEKNKEENKTGVSDDTATLKLSNNQPDGNCTTIAVGWLADQVRERIDGRVSIEVYNNGTLGGAISYLEQLQYGGMDTVKADLSTMINSVDEYNALMMPCIYGNAEYFWRVHGGDTGVEILRGDKMKEKKFCGLTYYDGEARCFYNTKKKIHSPMNIKSMLVKVQQSELMMSMVEALGGQSVATVCSEVCSAPQTNIVDTAKNSTVNYLDQSYFKVAPYFMEDHHTRSADILIMGKKLREELNAKNLKIIDDTALEPQEYQKEPWAEMEEESKQKLLEQGVTITESTEEELKVSQDACESIWYSHEGGVYKDIIDQIVEADR